jgi:predicted TIM-barrel fold metal-dependent hydrolase
MYSPDDFEIIDAHSHPFVGECIGAPYGHPKTMEEFDYEMKKVKVDYYAGSLVYLRPVTDYAEIRQLNEDALRVRDKYPSYIPGIQVHGDFPEESIADMHKYYHEDGIRLIGELVPYLMKTGEYNSPGMIEISKEAGKLGMTASLDGGFRETVVPVLENCPNLKVVLAHPGAPWGDDSAKIRFQWVSEYENLYMDISGTGLYRWNMLRYGIDVCGAHKLLFGSDMPVCSVGMYLYGVLSENLTKEELSLVLAGNFKRLLGMK